MTKIESIPTREENWEYLFLIDISGHIKTKKYRMLYKKYQITQSIFNYWVRIQRV